MILPLHARLDERQQMRLQWALLRATTGGLRAAMSTHDPDQVQKCAVRWPMTVQSWLLQFASGLAAGSHRPRRDSFC